MDRALKPARLEIEKVNEVTAKQYLHWKKCFNNYITTLADADTEAKKLMVLVNNISVENFSIVADCTTYTTAMAALEKHFIKTTNIIFSRHKLATRRQGMDETLDEYIVALHNLSRQCELKAVIADVYREELVRDAFVQGIRSSAIRQKLLEASVVELDKVVNLAQVLEDAHRSSESYSSGAATTFTSAAVQESSWCASASSSASSPVNKQCPTCGGWWHSERSRCPALNSDCHKCGKRGHFGRVCQSRKIPPGPSRGHPQRGYTRNRAAGMYPMDGATAAAAGEEVHDVAAGNVFNDFTYNDKNQFYRSTNFLSALSGSFPEAQDKSTKVGINGIALDAMVDTGSLKSYIHAVVASYLRINVIPQKGEVALANGTIVTTPGFVKVDLVCEGKDYEQVVLVVLPNAIADVI